VAEHVSPGTGAAPAPAQPQTEGRTARLARWQADLRGRFKLAYFLLAAIVGAAVGLLIVLLADTSTKVGPWSGFRPSQHGQAAASEIAAHVQKRYRLPNGRTLVGVLAREATVQPSDQPIPISAILVTSGYSDQRPEDMAVYRTGKTAFYALCGSGQQCTIPGKPSVQRLELIRRQLLELSLYSFKYLGADAVVAYAPPTVPAAGGASEPTLAFIRRSDWGSQLKNPLNQTLAPLKQLKPGKVPASEKSLVNRVKLWRYDFQQLPDASVALVLKPRG
jgi:hypothetical protein